MTENKTKEETIDNKENKITVRLNMNMLIVGVLSILVFVSIFQTVTLTTLMSRKSGTAAENSAPAAGAQNAGAGNSNLPSALQNVPQQVGGC